MSRPQGVRRHGDRALLVEFGDAVSRRAWDRHLHAHPLPGVVEVVPAALTLGLLLDGTRPAQEVAADLLGRPLPEDDATAVGSGEPAPAAVLEVPVVYDGPDLVEAAQQQGATPGELVAWHTGQLWTCDFVGFLPGFGYLEPQDSARPVPRRPDPRPRVPAGSVGLAGSWTGVYPQSSPGGWNLVGRTPLVLWDPRRDPPALVGAGTIIRFVEVRG